MKTTKKVDLGEYVIIIKYDDSNGALDITVLDELEETIESINIVNDDDTNDTEINPNLN